MQGPFVVAVDLHAGGGLAATGRRQGPFPFHLHDAGAAIASGAVPRLVTQPGNRHAVPLRRFHDGLSSLRFDLLSVQGKGDPL